MCRIFDLMVEANGKPSVLIPDNIIAAEKKNNTTMCITMIDGTKMDVVFCLGGNRCHDLDNYLNALLALIKERDNPNTKGNTGINEISDPLLNPVWDLHR